MLLLFSAHLALTAEQRALLTLGSFFGLMASSLLRLKWADVDINGDTLTITNPRNKTDRMWRGTSLSWRRTELACDPCNVLQALKLQTERGENGQKEDWRGRPLFPSFATTSGTSRLSTLLGKVLPELAGLAGPRFRVGPNQTIVSRSFRYGAPLALMEAGASDTRVKLLGKCSLDRTHT